MRVARLQLRAKRSGLDKSAAPNQTERLCIQQLYVPYLTSAGGRPWPSTNGSVARAFPVCDPLPASLLAIAIPCSLSSGPSFISSSVIVVGGGTLQSLAKDTRFEDAALQLREEFDTLDARKMGLGDSD